MGERQDQEEQSTNLPPEKSPEKMPVDNSGGEIQEGLLLQNADEAILKVCINTMIWLQTR